MQIVRRLSYYIDKFHLRASFEVPAKPVVLWAEDRVRIAGFELESAVESPMAFLVVHGLTGNHRAPGYREFAEALTGYGRVLTMDLRGHGLSGGISTLGDLEALDVAAGIASLRRAGLKVVVIGFSMGAAASIRCAALLERPDLIVAVSSLAEWSGEGGRRGPGARRTSRLWRIPGGVFALRALTGVRIERPAFRSESPVSVIHRISPVPILLVHGTTDDFFPLSELHQLYAAAGEPKSIWEIQGGGHSEGLFVTPGSPVDRSRVDAFTAELVGRMTDLAPAEFVSGVAEWRG